jgi:hypothetical protein
MLFLFIQPFLREEILTGSCWQTELLLQQILFIHVQKVRETRNSFDVWYIHSFLEYRSMWNTNENSPSWLHGEFVCMWSSCEYMFNMRSFDLRTTKVLAESRNTLPVIHLATASISACKSPKSVRIGEVHTIVEVVPKEIIGEIHVRWTWWPKPQKRSRYLFDRTRLPTHHVGRQEYIHCVCERAQCYHIPYFLNDWEWPISAFAKRTLLRSVFDLARLTLFIRLETLDIPAPSGINFYISYYNIP